MKLIKEDIRQYLRPKTKDEIQKAVLTIKISSYNLQSFFKLIDANEVKALNEICKDLNIEPINMQVSMLTEWSRKIMNRLFKPYKLNSDYLKIKSFHVYNYRYSYEFNGNKTYTYHTLLKVIKFGQPIDDTYRYYAFPKNTLNTILYNLLEPSDF